MSKCWCGDKQTFPWQDGAGDFKGRRRTNGESCCLFVATMIIVVGVVLRSVIENLTSDSGLMMKKLTHGVDYAGKICGVSTVDKPYLYFCGTNDWKDGQKFPEKLNFDAMTCVASCPSGDTETVDCLDQAMIYFKNKGEGNAMVGGKNVEFVDTLVLEVTQSVTKQKGYPSELLDEAFCVPKVSDELSGKLRKALEDGPLLMQRRISKAVSTFWGGWWLVLVGVCLTIILNLTFLSILQHFAGVTLLGTMCMCAVVLVVMGLYFVLSIFVGIIQPLNPIFWLTSGPEAMVLSLILGVFLLSASVCVYRNIQNQKIDENVGIIAAAASAMESHKMVFLGMPIFGAIIVAVLGVMLLYGYFLAQTVENLNSNRIAIEDESWYQGSGGQKQPIGGLQAKYEMDWWWEVCLKLYSMGAVWCMLVAIAIGNFMGSYTVVTFFFAPGTKQLTADAQKAGRVIEAAMDGQKKGSNNDKKIPGVVVKNAGLHEGPRKTAYQEVVNGQKFLVVPVGPILPNGREFHQWEETILEKTMPLAMRMWANGLGAAFWYHLGTLAVGAWVTTLTEPLRAIAMILKSFVGDASPLDEDTGCKSLVMTGLTLVAAYIDEFFGNFNKSMYSEVVLGSYDLSTASKKVTDLVGQHGGNVALLHGCSGIYEWVAIIMITGVVTLFTCIISQVLFGSDETVSVGLIVFATSVLAFLVSSLFMSLFDTTCNTLLYTFAWTRKNHKCLDMKEWKLHGNLILPEDMKVLLKKELEIESKDSLKPRGMAMRWSKHAHATDKYAQTLRKAWGESTIFRGNGGRGLMETFPLLGSKRP